MNTTYDPILEIQELRRFRVFAPLSAPRLGTALVLETDTGEPLVFQTGQRIPDPRLGNYRRSFLVDLGEYGLRLEEKLPSADPSFLFRSTVIFNCRVKKPEVIAQRGIRDMTASVRSPLVRIMRKVARMYDISKFNAAEAALNEELDKFSGDSSYYLGNYLVELLVGDETAARSSSDYHDANRDARIDAIRRSAMSSVVASGRDELIAQWLAKHEGDPSALLDMEAEGKMVESEHLLRAMSILASSGGDTEAFDTREERRRLLGRFLSDGGAGASSKEELRSPRRSRIAGSLGSYTTPEGTVNPPSPGGANDRSHPGGRSSRIHHGADSAPGQPEDRSGAGPGPEDKPAEAETSPESTSPESSGAKSGRVRGLLRDRPTSPRGPRRDPDASSGG